MKETAEAVETKKPAVSPVDIKPKPKFLSVIDFVEGKFAFAEEENSLKVIELCQTIIQGRKEKLREARASLAESIQRIDDILGMSATAIPVPQNDKPKRGPKGGAKQSAESFMEDAAKKLSGKTVGWSTFFETMTELGYKGGKAMQLARTNFLKSHKDIKVKGAGRGTEYVIP